MSEAIQTELSPYPGEAWTEIVRRPTLEEFSRAFASDVVLEASVLSRPIVGPMGLWGFFQATRAMYDRIGFTHEIGTKARMCLEWEGVFAGNPVAGVTIITRDDRGANTSVRLHHRPRNGLNRTERRSMPAAGLPDGRRHCARQGTCRLGSSRTSSYRRRD
jgi:hypothetical protein